MVDVVKKSLSGKKTYFVAVGMAMYAIGGAITGAHDYGHMVEVLIQAAGLIALRLGVEKAGA